MGVNIDAIMEAEEVQTFFEQNDQLLIEAEERILDFPQILESFIFENNQEFVGNSLEDTLKNIRVFSEVATAQYIQEVSAVTATHLKDTGVLQESSLSDYI